MKKLCLCLSVLLPLFSFSQEVHFPEFALRSHESLEIIKAERSENGFQLDFKITNYLDEGGNFCVNPDTRILAGGKEYKLKEINGIPACPDSHQFEFFGDQLYFSLLFEGLPEGTRVADLVEYCDQNCFFFRGMIIDPELNAQMKAAFNLHENQKYNEALAAYNEMLSGFSTGESVAESYCYFSIISILLELENTTDARLWLEKFRGRKLPESSWVEELLQSEWK